jgi:hypothetical protein
MLKGPVVSARNGAPSMEGGNAQKVFLSRRPNRRFPPLITKDFERRVEAPFRAG